ncbi:hypothetical protein Y1Q_0014482 [Alligator mississippiensis]|uniref:Uncharacterized protein n=1 Tax=Alligator mississippiensis TaxID=8496 RepID=A0A151PCS1_ALLMI|nr:hypothetical protein Y1Q_0014482 [Alligator mississippiensis]
MPFYEELSHFLVKDRAIETLHTYSTTQGQKESLAGNLGKEEVYGVPAVVDNTLQDNREVAIVVDEHLDSLDLAGDVDVYAIHSPHVFGEAYAAEAGDHLLQVDEVDEEID